MYEAVCPACGENIKFTEDLQVGQNTVCPKCRELLAVVMNNPLIFDRYSFANSVPQWFDSEKEESAKKHERKNKHNHPAAEEYEDDFLRRSAKKIHNKNRVNR